MDKINVLVVGSGGREHALAWKIKSSPLLNKLFLYAPNDGFKHLGEEIEATNYETLARLAKANHIELVVVGPELPLSLGIVDTFNKVGIKCIGANKDWARLESSKAFAKEFMKRHDIPTARHELISNIEEMDKVFSKFIKPPVLKADGLAAGKGVYIPTNFDDARNTLKDFLNGKYGKASSNVVVEEFLEGEELSVISIFDGKTLKTFVGARDYKRLKNDNAGPNTGGMGAYCPVEISGFHQEKIDNYLEKLKDALIKEGADFSGIIYSGLMLTKDDAKVLEYNMRFGDPETQPLMMHLKSDILEIFVKATQKKLNEIEIEWHKGSAMCVVVASQGYPDCPKKGCDILQVKEAEKEFGVKVFYAGVKKTTQEHMQTKATNEIEHNHLLSDGGRVMCICAQEGPTCKNIRKNIYKACDKINFSDKIYRTDIAKHLES